MLSKTRQKWLFSGIFNELLSNLNVNVVRFARNVECDFFCDFQTWRTQTWTFVPVSCSEWFCDTKEIRKMDQQCCWFDEISRTFLFAEVLSYFWLLKFCSWFYGFVRNVSVKVTNHSFFQTPVGTIILLTNTNFFMRPVTLLQFPKAKVGLKGLSNNLLYLFIFSLTYRNRKCI